MMAHNVETQANPVHFESWLPAAQMEWDDNQRTFGDSLVVMGPRPVDSRQWRYHHATKVVTH